MFIYRLLNWTKVDTLVSRFKSNLLINENEILQTIANNLII